MQDLTPGVSVGLVGVLADLGTQDRAVVVAIALARLALLAAIFASILPGSTTTWPEVAAATIALVCANTAISIAYARTERLTLEFAAAEFAALLAVNLGLVYLASRFIGEPDSFPLAEGLFLALLGTLILWLYDAYKPLADVRFAGSGRSRRRREA